MGAGADNDDVSCCQTTSLTLTVLLLHPLLLSLVQDAKEAKDQAEAKAKADAEAAKTKTEAAAVADNKVGWWASG
jgi:hypothetical protein